MELIDNVGFFGPIILFGFGIYTLRTRRIYLIIYAIFFVLNGLLNRVLKMWIREPRPDNSQFINEYDVNDGAEQYGMPSGHAQSVAYSVVFLFLATGSVRILSSTLFLSALTIYQRWAYHRHTEAQLGIGALIGSVVGTIAFWSRGTAVLTPSA